MLENQSLRNDIKMGEVALTQAVESYGEKGATSASDVLTRANLFYNWLLNERKG